MCSVKKAFLKNSQNSQENTCNFIKKETLAQCEFCEIFKNVFYRTPPVAATVAIMFLYSQYLQST